MSAGSGKRQKGRKTTGTTYPVPGHDASASPPEVRESYPGGAGNRGIESLLADIVVRLERIEEKIDETVYPPESAIKPEMIRKIRKAHADIRKGKGKTYESIDEFFQEIEA